MAPKSYKSRFIEPGLISYTDSDQGVVLVSREALDQMAPTFKGCPVIFVAEHHNDANKDNSFNFEDIRSNPADGVVVGDPYWGDDGWQWVDHIVWNEDAQRALEQEYEVSCSYDPDETEDGGEYHKIPYDYSVVKGHYNHLAIVPRGRYENTRTLSNSKGGLDMAIFGKPKKKDNAIPPVTPEKKPGEEQGAMLNDDAEIDIDGVMVPVHELVSLAEEVLGIGETSPQDGDSISLSDGTTKTVAELKDIYRQASATKAQGEEAQEGEPVENAEPPTDTAGVSPVDQSKQLKNAKPAPKPAVNAALRNAALNPEGEKPGRGVETESQRLERGHARYSIPVKNGGSK